MDDITSSDLQTILISKRAHIYYLEHCRILANGGRVEYITDEKKLSAYRNIPIANTTALLLGSGTSVTQAAMRELSKAGVVVGFCGGDGTPLFSANDLDHDITWFLPHNEYRPTEYLQAWCRFWFDDQKRLHAAKQLQTLRLQFIQQQWHKRYWQDQNFKVNSSRLEQLLTQSQNQLWQQPDNQSLLTEEGRLSKQLYALAAQTVGYGDFTRVKQGKGTDPANKFLDNGNYLAYGLAASACWVLGLPHGMAVLHGKTRRGALVFDVADLVKDALVLPQAFISAMAGHDAREFRQACTYRLLQQEALDFMIDGLKSIIANIQEH